MFGILGIEIDTVAGEVRLTVTKAGVTVARAGGVEEKEEMHKA